MRNLSGHDNSEKQHILALNKQVKVLPCLEKLEIAMKGHFETSWLLGRLTRFVISRFSCSCRMWHASSLFVAAGGELKRGLAWAVGHMMTTGTRRGRVRLRLDIDVEERRELME